VKIFWILLIFMDDGSGTFQMTQQYAQYYTKGECIAKRNIINQSAINARAECYALQPSKEK
jgi:hypothetical protein